MAAPLASIEGNVPVFLFALCSVLKPGGHTMGTAFYNATVPATGIYGGFPQHGV